MRLQFSQGAYAIQSSITMKNIYSYFQTSLQEVSTCTYILLQLRWSVYTCKTINKYPYKVQLALKITSSFMVSLALHPWTCSCACCMSHLTTWRHTVPNHCFTGSRRRLPHRTHYLVNCFTRTQDSTHSPPTLLQRFQRQVQPFLAV